MRVIGNVVNLFIEEIKKYNATCLQVTPCDERKSSTQMFPHEEPAMKGYMSCGETFS